jgi:hypothetical protein
MVDTLPGIERIKIRFLSLLVERQGVIAHHALAAWSSEDPADRQSHLIAAQNVLHQIAGTAGSLGFGSLGQAARDCENDIIVHLTDNDEVTINLPIEIVSGLDNFVSMSQSLLSENV